MCHRKLQRLTFDQMACSYQSRRDSPPPWFPIAVLEAPNSATNCSRSRKEETSGWFHPSAETQRVLCAGQVNSLPRRLETFLTALTHFCDVCPQRERACETPSADSCLTYAVRRADSCLTCAVRMTHVTMTQHRRAAPWQRSMMDEVVVCEPSSNSSSSEKHCTSVCFGQVLLSSCLTLPRGTSETSCLLSGAVASTCLLRFACDVRRRHSVFSTDEDSSSSTSAKPLPLAGFSHFGNPNRVF